MIELPACAAEVSIALLTVGFCMLLVVLVLAFYRKS